MKKHSSPQDSFFHEAPTGGRQPGCQPRSTGVFAARRAWLGGVGAALLLAACQSPVPATATVTAPAPPPVDKQAAREAELRRLGFKRTDDGWEFSFPGKLLFETASDALDVESLVMTERISKGLVQLGIDSLRVEGHTDNVGSAQYNQTLSLRRAEAVARALAAGGLPFDQIQVRGHGKDKPIVDNGTPEGRSQNRRVAVVVQSL